MENYSRQQRINILKKIIYVKQVNNAIKRCNIKKGSNLYAFEYLKLNPNKRCSRIL